jgi:hypothetical protein
MAQSGGGSKEDYSTYEQQLNPEKDSICPSKPGETHKIKVFYIFLDVSGSMESVVSVVQKFMAGLSTKYPLIDLILVPFGYCPNGNNALTIVKYRVQTYAEFVSQNISWCTFGTNQYALVEFLKSFTGEIPFGFIFIGDGQFTVFQNGYNYAVPATDFINALTNAAIGGKLNNCGFMHFIYFATSSKAATNKELESYLSNSFQTVLRVNKQTCIPYSTGLTTNFPMTVTKYNPDYYTIPGFQIRACLFPQTIVNLIDTLGEHRSQFIMVMIEYMIRAMTTDWKLFALKNSVYSTLHRVLSMMKNTRLIDLMTDVAGFVSKTAKLWNIHITEKPTSEYTIEDIYTYVIDEWAKSHPDKTVFKAIGQLRKDAFGGEEQLNYLKWLNNRMASYKVVIKTTFVVDPLGKYSMKEFVEFARTLFDNIIVLSAECDIPDGYKFLAMVSTIGECRWTALKTLTESIGVVLNTSKTFVLGCALHEAITSEVSGEPTENSKNLYRLSELFNTARFTDPTVAEGVFKARDPNTGNEYFETSNFSPHVIGLVLKFIIDRGLKFKTMDFIEPFMKNKQQFEKNKSIIQRFIGAFQSYQVKVAGCKHPNHGKLFKLHYKKNPNDNVPSIGILYYSHGGIIKFMYLDDHPEPGKLFNRDCYLIPTGQNPTDIGQFVGDFTKFDLNSDWKNNAAIRQINSLLYHEYREKFLKGNYSSNHDAIMTKITGYMTEREATLGGGEKIRYVTHARSVSVIDACRMLGIQESQLDLYNSGHYPIQTYIAAKTAADINPITQFNTRPDLRVMDDDTNAPVTSDDVRLVVNVKNPEFPDCVMCECPIIPGYDKLITSCDNCKYYICHNCQSSQRSLFTAAVKKGGCIPFNLCACPECGEFSKTMYKLVTSSYYGTATRVQKLVESGKPIYACTASKHGQCRGIVCVDDIGCVQADGAAGIFSCDSCSSGEQPILIKCPGCEGYMTHNGNSCNMMRHCMYGEHGCYINNCPGCGPGKDCCGAKFVLSKEVCVHVPVTITIPCDRLKITMADLFTMNSAGKIVPFRP